VAGLDPAGFRRLVADWFCPTMGHSGVVAALVARGLGVEVALEEARPGDLCQFWRSVDLARPSGHSVIFLGLEVRGGVQILRYWSSQQATGGVGRHAEAIGPDWSVHLVRVGAATSRYT